MTDKPKLTLSNPKIKANPSSILSQNTEGVSLTETLSQDKSNLQNSSSANLSNKNLKINTVKVGQSTTQAKILYSGLIFQDKFSSNFVSHYLLF